MRRNPPPQASTPTASQQRGYALLLMLVLVTLGLLFTVVSQLSLVGAKAGRAQSTQAALLQAKDALLGYAATYRDTHAGEVFGYLPCPDADGDGDADTINDSTNCGSSSQIVIGLLPYKTLGLSDLRDSDGECLWYAVSPSHKAGLTKVEPMNWDSRGQIKILDSDGTTVLADPVYALGPPEKGVEGGAVAVIFAAGPPLSNNTVGRGNDQSKTCGNTGKVNWKAFLESASFDAAGNALVSLDAFGNLTSPPLIVTKGIIGNASNNDQIAWVTPKDIFTRVKQRSDHAGLLNTLTTEIRTALEGKVTSDLAAGTAPVNSLPDTPTPITNAQVGSLPTTISVANSNDAKLLNNWKEQYRMVVCNNLCGYCLNVGVGAGVQHCNGALLFGAEHTTGGPRPTHPAPLTDLLETDGPMLGDGLGALNIATDATKPFTGLATYSKGSNDVGVCVAPDTSKPVTFSCNIGSFTQQSTHSGTASEATIDTTAATVTLGNTTAGSPGNGCIWYPTALPFHTVLRAYFSFKIVNQGEGFVFALADAARNASGPVCGSSAANRLGYEGNSYPKFGLEIDTRRSIATNDPSAPPASSTNHYAFLYWGTRASTTDDNTHGAGTLGSQVEPQNPTSSLSSSSCIQSASWSSNVATVTTTTSHGLTSGQKVTITGITPTAYNPTSSGNPITVTATVIDPTHFTYPLTLASNPGISSGGNVSSADIGISSLTTCDTHLPYATWPNNTDIYVRIDITKSYTAPTGTYNFKAYIATTFPTCSLADFQNVSNNLSDLCTTFGPSIEQDGIALDDIGGLETMANVFAGFTSGQRATATSNENVLISNFSIRSQ